MTNITINRVFNPSGTDDGQVRFDANLDLSNVKSEVDRFLNAYNSDITQLLSVVSPYEVGVNSSSFLNIPTSTLPLSVRSSDKTEQIANLYDNSIVVYKQIVFTPDFTPSGQNRPYTASEIDNLFLNFHLKMKKILYLTDFRITVILIMLS